MANVKTMTVTDRIAEVLTRSKKNFGPEIVRAIDSLLTKTNLAILAGTLTLWAGSHLFGVGEVIDVLLLLVGVFTIGWSIGEVAENIFTFANKTINARTDQDLDVAAAAFSRAIVLAGITVIMALLLRRSVKEIQTTRGLGIADAVRPRTKPGLPAVGQDPAAGKLWSRPGIATEPNLPAGAGVHVAVRRSAPFFQRHRHRTSARPGP